MRYNRWLILTGLLVVLLLLNACGGGEGTSPESESEPAATSPPSSIGSESSHLVAATVASPGEKVEPTRAITAETAAEIGQPIGGAVGSPQTNSTNGAEPIHRHNHIVYLLIIVHR